MGSSTELWVMLFVIFDPHSQFHTRTADLRCLRNGMAQFLADAVAPKFTSLYYSRVAGAAIDLTVVQLTGLERLVFFCMETYEDSLSTACSQRALTTLYAKASFFQVPSKPEPQFWVLGA